MWLVYLLVGFAYDILITMYYQMIIEQKAIMAGIISFIITVVQVFIIYWLILSPDMISNSVAYAVGCAVGTALTVYLKKKKGNIYEQISSCLISRRRRKS